MGPFGSHLGIFFEGGSKNAANLRNFEGLPFKKNSEGKFGSWCPLNDNSQLRVRNHRKPFLTAFYW